jgi:hypothetical protein
LTSSLTASGYVQLSKAINGTRLEHRIVWEQHNGPIPKGMHIHHIDGVKTNNNIDNLSLVTPTQNQARADCWGKGYSLMTDKPRVRPYKAYRLTKHLGQFGTPCGAMMASRMAYIND